MLEPEFSLADTLDVEKGEDLVLNVINNIKNIKAGNLLVVDDEPDVVSIIQEMLENDSYNIVSAYSFTEAASIIHRQNINIVLTDLILNDGSGIDVLQEARRFHPDCQVVLMTGCPSVQNAVDVIKQGAYDYLVKPFTFDTIKMTLGRAMEKIRLEQENIKLRELMSVYQISEAMGSIIELDSLLDLILNTAVKEYEADVASIFFTNNQTGELELKASAVIDGFGFTDTIKEHCFEISRRTIQDNLPLKTDDPDFEFIWGERTIKSSISQPLLAKGKTLGTLVVVRINNNHPFTQGHLTGLAILASKAATAIENSNLYEDLKKTYLATVEALANAVEARDPYTRGHNERVYLLSQALATELGWTSEQMSNLKIGALLHDIGKIGVPDCILNKPGPLTYDEQQIMKKHPLIGAKMIESISFLKPAIPFILYHHERNDGTGYPMGLEGEAIPLPGRLLAVVDTIDAITSDRPYRKGRTMAVAIDEILRFSGSQFSPPVVEACLAAFKKGKLDFLFKDQPK
jgi:putative nucleotidyltransferase with HDIG domain